MREMTHTLGRKVRPTFIFGLTFTFIYGWKITEVLDLILLASAAIGAWVYVLSEIKLRRTELLVVVILLVLSVYSFLISIAFGAVDTQAGLRSMRALVNFVGGAGLVAVYVAVYREEAARRLLLMLYGCVLVHALLICAMFFSEGLRARVYAITSAHQYVNQNAPFLLGLRIPGLTYGLASTSVVQLTGLLLVPALLAEYGRGVASRLCVWVSVVPILISIFLTGRSGLLFAIAFLPILVLFSRSDAPRKKAGGVIGYVLPLSLVVGFLSAVAWANRDFLTNTFAYTLQHAGEIVEFLEEGKTDSTARIGGMYFLPNDLLTLLFGSSNLGRGDLGYIASDVGYVKLIFAVGIIGLVLNVLPYIVGLNVSARWYLSSASKHLPLATMLCLAAGLLLNFKELALLTRNQWSIQSLLVALAIYERSRQVRGTQQQHGPLYA